MKVSSAKSSNVPVNHNHPGLHSALISLSARSGKFRATSAFILSVALLLSGGCTSKSKAKQEARTAYLAGQQEAMMRMQQSKNPIVTVQGKVRNSVVTWTEDLTVAKAIVAADYYGYGDPREIILVRQGIAKRIDPKKLLSGEDDLALQPGDIMEIR